ncbi:MAG: ParB/RepB/Spo0J family partition protein [Chloroflexota bacterium]
MTKKRGLGRGLSALIPAGETELSTDSIRTLPVTAILPNPHQPRTTALDEEKLTELAASIKEHGLIQPLIVTEQEGQFYLIAGERRWRASQLAGLQEVTVVVKEATPQDMLELAIIENIQRADLNALEEAYAYQQLIEEFGMTQEDIAQSVGKGRSTVANLLRLLTLPPGIQQAVIDGEISGAHARALLPLETQEQQTHALNQIINLNLSVRQTESLVKLQALQVCEEVREAVLLGQISFKHAQVLEGLPTAEAQIDVLKQIILRNYTLEETELLLARRQAGEKPKAKPKKTIPPELLDLQNQFEQSLGTRVTIAKKRQGGQVIIDYYSDEELQTIYEVIVGGDVTS